MGAKKNTGGEEMLLFSAPSGYVAVPVRNRAQITQFFTSRQPLKTQLVFYVTPCSLRTAALNSQEAKALHEY